MISLIGRQNPKNDTYEFFTKQKQIYGYQGGKGRRDKLGVWYQLIQTTIYKIVKQQSPRERKYI